MQNAQAKAWNKETTEVDVSQAQSVEAVLGCLLKQLAYQLEYVPAELNAAYDDSVKRGGRSSFEGLFIRCLAKFAKVFMFVDAFDECLESQQKSLLDFLKKSLEVAPNLFVCVTSRLHLLNDLQQMTPSQTRIEIRASDEDILKYLKDQLNSEENLDGHDDLKAKLQELIRNNAKGQYCLL